MDSFLSAVLVKLFVEESDKYQSWCEGEDRHAWLGAGEAGPLFSKAVTVQSAHRPPGISLSILGLVTLEASGRAVNFLMS